MTPDRDDPILDAMLEEVLGGRTPPDLSARPLKGKGWSLELTNACEVVPGDRPGDVTIRKK